MHPVLMKTPVLLFKALLGLIFLLIKLKTALSLQGIDMIQMSIKWYIKFSLKAKRRRGLELLLTHLGPEKSCLADFFSMDECISPRRTKKTR